MQITLHYAQVNQEIINELSFPNLENFKTWLHHKVKFDIGDRVYLFTHDWPDVNDLEQTEIFVTEKIGVIADLVEKAEYFGFDLIPVFYLQEYPSYEDAYKVALNMKELSPICYNP